MKSRHLRFALFTTVALAAVIAQAQIQNQPTEVITASPLSTFSDRAGAWPITSIPSDVTQSEVEGLDDTYNRIPGLQARENGSPTVSIRGSSSADRVLRLFEGIPLNLADGTGSSPLLFPVEAIGDIRVFKNPASVYYGPYAMAGAIGHRLRIFERPALRFNIADDTGTIGARSAFFALPYATGSAQSPNSQITAFIERKPGRYEYESVTGAGTGRREQNHTDTVRFTAATDARVGATLVRPRLIAAESKGQLPARLATPSFEASDFKFQGLLFSLEALHPFSEVFLFGARVSHFNLKSDTTDSTGLTSSTSARTSAALDARWTVAPFAVSRTFADINVDRLSATFYPGQDFDMTTFELGQTLELAASPTLTIQPGLRYRANDGQVFKSVALTKLFDNDRTWLTYSEGFRAASLSERFATTSYFVGNSGLQPERSEGFELGAQIERGKRFGGFLDGYAFGATLFHTRYTNLVERTLLPSGAGSVTNAGKARSFGGELEAAYGVSVWNFALSYGYLNTKNEETGTELELSPKHQLTATVSQQIGPVVIEAETTHWSSFLVTQRPMPSWTTVDLVARTLALTDWEAKAGVLNLFDVPREFTIGYPEQQRRFFVSVLRYL